MFPSSLLASSDVVRSVDDAFLWIFGISIFFIVGLTIAMIALIVKYRRSKHPEPADIHGSMKLEITWIVIPTLIVIFMFFKGYEGFILMRNPPDDAMVVDVEARQWFFSFHYPDDGITTSELHVPEQTPIKLNLTAPADDVIHSFYIPAFRTKEDCVPGYTNEMWFEADKPGRHTIFCAEFCGKDHAKMHTVVVVHPQDEYEAWLTKRVEERFAPIVLDRAVDPNSEEIQARDAPALYQTYCASCHGPEGRGGLVEGARDFRQLEGWKNGPTLVGIFTTLTEGLDGTQMRAFTNLSAWDRFALAHYVRSFYKGDDRKVSTPEELEALVAKYELDKQQVVARTFPIDEAMRLQAEENEER